MRICVGSLPVTTRGSYHDPQRSGVASLPVEDRVELVVVELNPRLIGKYGLLVLED